MMDENNSEQGESQNTGSETFEETDPSFVDGQKKSANAGTLGIVGLLAIGGAAFYFFFIKNGPAPAMADDTSSAIINDFLHGSSGNSKLMEQTLHDTEKVVKEFQTHAHKNQIPVEELTTNPFRLKSAKPKTDDVAVAVPSHIREDEERERITTEANGLELGSIVRGGRSACLVNNTLYHQGEQIGNFTVVEIRAKSVVVRQGKYSFELTMKK